MKATLDSLPSTARARRTSSVAAAGPGAAGGLLASRRRAGLLFSLPVAALVTVLLLYPIGETVYYSFTTGTG